MCRFKKMPVMSAQYSGDVAWRVLDDVEIEIRRLIIEYQRKTLTPPPWELVQMPSDAAVGECAAVQEPANEVQFPPMPSEKELDEIMPLPMKPKKKKLSEIIAAGDNATPLPGQIDIEEAIAEAETQAPANDVAPPQSAASAPETVSAPPARPEPVSELSPAQRLSARWLEFSQRRYDARQERRLRRRYYRSLEFQVKCNIEPLEELLEFIQAKRR